MDEFVPVPLTAQLDLGYSDGQGNTWSNGIAFKNTVAWDVASLTALATAASNAYEELLAPNFSTTTFLVEVTATSLAAADAPWYKINLSTPIQGSRAGSPQAASSCMTITKQTAKRGRAYRGRIYMSGLTSTDLASAKRWGVSSALANGNSWAEWSLAVEGEGTWKAVLISRTVDGTHLLVPETNEITNWVGRTPTATQRGRSGNGRRNRVSA